MEFKDQAYEALCSSIHMWRYLAETGNTKDQWDYYSLLNVGEMFSECALCDIFCRERNSHTACTKDGVLCPLIAAEDIIRSKTRYDVCARWSYARWADLQERVAFLDIENDEQTILMLRDDIMVHAQSIVNQLMDALGDRPLLSLDELIDHSWRWQNSAV